MGWWVMVGTTSFALTQLEIEGWWSDGMDTVKHVEEHGWPETPPEEHESVPPGLQREITDILDELTD